VAKDAFSRGYGYRVGRNEDEFAPPGRPVTLFYFPSPRNLNRGSYELTRQACVADAELRLKQLMLLGLEGDATAYRALLSDLSGRLRAYYRKRLGSGVADAEDLVQETLIALHNRRASFDRAQPFTAWVYAIARYKLVDHLRRARVRVAESVEDCEALFAVDDVEQAASSRDVERLLGTLPAATREAIRLTRIEGHSIEEVSERTGKSVTAIKVSIHRGLLRLSGKQGQKSDAND